MESNVIVRSNFPNQPLFEVIIDGHNIQNVVSVELTVKPGEVETLHLGIALMGKYEVQI